MELFISVALLPLFAVARAGRDVFLIARQSTLYGRDISIWASLGISIGILMHSFLSIAGIYILLSLYPDFIFYMKIIASLYIASIGVRTLLVNNQIEISSLSDQKNITATKSFVMGFFTNALNPKAFLFFIMVFSLISNTNPSNEIKILLGVYMAGATFIWFTLISISFSKISKGEFIKKNLPYLEKIIGVILILIALQILYLDYL